MAMQGVVPPEQLSAIAMAKSMVSWHQRHGYCANCGTRTAMKEGGWKRECPSCKAEHFPRTDPVVIMLVTSGDKCLLGRQKQFPAGHVVVPRRLRRSRRDHRGRGPPRDFRGIRHPLHRRQLLHDAALALSVVADDRLHRARDSTRTSSSTAPNSRTRAGSTAPRSTLMHQARSIPTACLPAASVRDCASSDRALAAWGQRTGA